jgi:hypothetical protein
MNWSASAIDWMKSACWITVGMGVGSENAS